MEKDYLIGQLEKKINDSKYYLSIERDKKSQITTINELDVLLHQLRKVDLEKKERKIIYKAVDLLERIRKIIK